MVTNASVRIMRLNHGTFSFLILSCTHIPWVGEC
jgi:hypothetical protein